MVASVLAACASGPNYVRPTMELRPAYKESGAWKSAEPRLADAVNPWWSVFDDPVLDGLERQANAANQNIRRSEALYRQAHALAEAARSAYFPSVNVGASDTRARARTVTGASVASTALGVSLGASWEPDLWGSVRRSVEAADAGARASAYDLAGARLSVQSELARDYLQLRVTDVVRELYAQTTAAYERALQLTESQYRAGVVLHSDVALAQAQLKMAQAQCADLDGARAQLEHAIAILIGRRRPSSPSRHNPSR